MHNCKDCGAELREEFNLCPYCGFPTDKIIKELEELKGIVDENSTPEEILSAIAASAAQMTVTMQTPDEVLASKEQEPVLSAAMPTPEGKEFGGPQMGSLERAQREVDAKKNSGKSEDTKDLKSYFNRRNVVGMLLALIVIVCMVIIIFFNNVMEPDLQMELGNDYLTAEKYDKAEKAFTNVLKQDANNADAITKLIQSKKAINEDYKENLEIILLIDRLQKLTVDAEKIKELDYQKVSLYMEIGEKGNAQKIMQKYIPLPAFVSKSGVYPEGTLFEITVPKGKIEYTIDKDKTPIVYSGAIMLEPGSRTVRAYAVDENGIKSEVIEAYYVITADDAKTLEKN